MNSDAGRNFDIAIIGGGRAGIGAALHAAKLGYKSAIVESRPEFFGGRRATGAGALEDALVRLATTTRDIGLSGMMGLTIPAPPAFDEDGFWAAWSRLAASRRRASEEIVARAGITLFPYQAFLSQPRQVLLLDPASGDERLAISANTVLLCTGRPEMPTEARPASSTTLLQAIETKNLALLTSAQPPTIDRLEICAALHYLGFPKGNGAESSPRQPNPLSRLEEVLQEFLAPANGLEHLFPRAVRAISAGMADGRNQRPTGNHPEAAYLGLRKFGGRFDAWGRVSRQDGSFTISVDHEWLLATGSCSASPGAVAPEFLRHSMMEDARLAVESIAGRPSPTVPFDPIPEYRSALLFAEPFEMRGDWGRLGEPGLVLEEHRSLSGCNSLQLRLPSDPPDLRPIATMRSGR